MDTQRQHLIRCVASLLLATAAGISVTGAEAGAYGQLPELKDIPELAALEASWQSLPRRELSFRTTEPDGSRWEVAAEEVGVPVDGRPTLVLLHGVMADRSTWRLLAGALGQDEHLLLVDLLGCGQSQKPRPERLGPDGYSPDAQARRLLQVLRAYLSGGGANERLTLVGHSYGGAVALRMLGKPEFAAEYADVLDRTDALVLLAPLDFSQENLDPRWSRVLKAGSFQVGMAAAFGALKNKTASSVREGLGDPGLACREDAWMMRNSIRGRSSRRAFQAMLRQSVPMDADTKQPRWRHIEQLTADYGRVELPCLILWGSRDETFGVATAYKLNQEIPDAWLRVVPETGHSLMWERPAAVAAEIAQFLDGHGQGWTRTAGLGGGRPTWERESARAAH